MPYLQRFLLTCVLGFGVACSKDGEPPLEKPSDADESDDDGEQAERDAGRRPDATTSRDAGRDAAKSDQLDASEQPRDAASDAISAAMPDATTSTGETGTLPAVTDLARPGPFTPTRAAGPAGYVLFHPKELGKDGVKHPILAWGPGAAENAGSFITLLNHFASHGFAVISFDGTPDGQELVEGLDWMIAENARDGSAFFQKLDTARVASGGHSAGSLATFKIAKDPRLTTTLHLCGGTFDPHTDIDNLHAPALFLCGDPPVDGLLVGDVARPNCDIDFANVKVPVVYGIPKGASHMSPTEIGDATLRSRFAAASVGWLRYQLADDATQEAMFLGPTCTLCKDSNWTLQQKNWP
jgi:hypothetical protein